MIRELLRGRSEAEMRRARMLLAELFGARRRPRRAAGASR